MNECFGFWIEIIYKITLIGGILAGLITYYWRVYKRKRQEKILSQLGELRAKGVALRNEGTKPKKGTELVKWKKEVEDITEEINNTAKIFDPVIGEILSILDTYEPKIFYGQAPDSEYGPDQLRQRDILSARLERVKDMIDKYYAPKSYSSECG